MAVTTTAFKSLLSRLKKDLPQFTFAPDDTSRWSSESSTVWYNEHEAHADVTLLHEVSHGALGHSGYLYDIDLVKLERAAWEKAAELAAIYGVDIPVDYPEHALDSYRDWLHMRSLCPDCSQNGVQQTEHTYVCLMCNQKWRVNDARSCGLKRRTIRS